MSNYLDVGVFQTYTTGFYLDKVDSRAYLPLT